MCTVCRSDVIKDLCLLRRKMEHLSADLTEPEGEILSVWRDGAHRWGYAPVQWREKAGNRSLEGLLWVGSCSPAVILFEMQCLHDLWEIDPVTVVLSCTYKTWIWKPGLPGARSSVDTLGNPAAGGAPRVKLMIGISQEEIQAKARKVQGIPRCLQEDHNNNNNKTKPTARQRNLTEGGSAHLCRFGFWGWPRTGQESTAEGCMRQISFFTSLRLCSTSQSCIQQSNVF